MCKLPQSHVCLRSTVPGCRSQLRGKFGDRGRQTLMCCSTNCYRGTLVGEDGDTGKLKTVRLRMHSVLLCSLASGIPQAHGVNRS
jgi:hypothetical protein